MKINIYYIQHMATDKKKNKNFFNEQNEKL